MEERRRGPEYLTGRLGLGWQEVAGCLVGTVSSTGATAAAGVAAPLLLLHTTGVWRNWQAGAVDVGQGFAWSGAVCDRGGRQGPRSQGVRGYSCGARSRYLATAGTRAGRGIGSNGGLGVCFDRIVGCGSVGGLQRTLAG